MATPLPLKVKSAPDYTTPDTTSKGGPKNGHLSELDPTFAAARDAADAAVAALWQADDWPSFRELWKAAAPLPPDCPRPGVDVDVSYRKVPVRDGAEVEIKVMRGVEATGDKSLLVLRLHRGGWAIGGHEMEAVENLRAAATAGVVLVSVDYRLAPEFPFPYAVNDNFDVLKWCKKNAVSLGIDPERICVMGGSAGSNIAAVVVIMARDEGITGIVGQVLDFPVTCHPKFFADLKDQYELESYVQNSEASIVTAVKMEVFLDAYMPDAKPDPLHSPLLTKNLKGLPPAFIQIAGYDPLRDEGIAFAERLKSEGNQVDLHVYKGLPHFFPMLFGDLPQTKDYYARQDAFVKKLASQ